MFNFHKGEAFSVVRINNFRLFLAYRFLMTTATLMQSVIIGWQLYDLTHSVLSLGLIGLTEVIPQVGIALFAGHYVDILNRRKIIIYTTTLLLLGSGILVAYSVPQLNCFALYGTVPIFITVFITGLVRGILMPAHQAIMGQLVPRNLLHSAATWNSTNWHIAAVLGPAIGGLLYGFFGIIAAYSTVFLLYFLSIFMMVYIKNIGEVSNNKSEEGIFKSIAEGIRYVFKTPVLLGAFSLDMFAVLFGGAVAMLPAFASDVLHVGPQGLGLLRACPAAGAIIMSVYLTFKPPLNRTGTYLLYSVAGFGLCMIAFALSKNFYLSASVLFLSGVFDNVSVVIRGTILQLFTPDEIRGRVSAVNSIFIGSSNELGAFESGLAAKIMGLIPSVIFGGAMTLIVVIITTKYVPSIRKLSLKKVIHNL